MLKSRLENNRPRDYFYFDMVKENLGGNLSQIFNGKMVYPRQIELHLPGDGIIPCNFNCYHCQARKLKKDLVRWEKDALQLIKRLGGKISWIILGGQYTEPLLNPYFLDFIREIKRSGVSYGLHTNGSLFKDVAEQLCYYSTSFRDFVSCSLDAGSIESHMKVKNIKVNMFDDVIKGLAMLTKYRGKRIFPAIRVTYLMTKQNIASMEIKNVVTIMKKIKPDTFRFSIPYAYYGDSLTEAGKYKEKIELRYEKEYFNLIAPYLSQKPERPFIFWLPPRYQDIYRMKFIQCICGYFSIVLGADGWIYKCSSSTAPDFEVCRLDKITNDIEKFKKMIIKNQNPNWMPNTCFSQGARCNRIMLEINNAWKYYA